MTRILLIASFFLLLAPAASVRAADCATECRAIYAYCMEHSASLGDQKACKDQLNACEAQCESLAPDAEISSAGTGDPNRRYYCRVTWNFGFSDSTYEGWGPTEEVGLSDARNRCERSNIIPIYKGYCGRKIKSHSCKDQGA